MNNEQKERLEQELNFLKESLEADVISRDEYERGRERIERKLKESEESGEKIEEVKEEPPREEPKEELSDSKNFQSKPEIEIKEIKEKPTKIIGAEEETAPIEKKEELKVEEKEPVESPAAEEPTEEPEEEIVISKKWLYGIAILIIAAIIFFAVRGCTKSEETFLEENQVEGQPLEEETIEEFTPECSSDSDCKQEGMIGTCSAPDTKEAKCEFKEDISTNLIVINDKTCSLCDSSNTKTIVKSIFPNVKIREIDYETEEAKNLTNKIKINALPAYIFDSDVAETANFNNFKSALVKIEDNYIITNTASGANYFFKRPLIENKLDLYLSETNERIESSMQEVMDLFKDNMEFTKKIVTEQQKDQLEKELAINTYPTFVLNNQIKFRGILPANTIKEKICQVNDLEDCSQELSKI